MDDFKVDSESAERAESLSSRLLQDARAIIEQGRAPSDQYDVFSENFYAKEAGDVPIQDVLGNVGDLAADFAIHIRRDGLVLCAGLEGEGFVPISLRESAAGPMVPWNKLQRAPRENDQAFVEIGEALVSVERSLSRFLSCRFAGAKQWLRWSSVFGSSSGPSAQPLGSAGRGTAGGMAARGLQVQVSCRTRGLRIHIAPAYFINWVYFGSPTTPVSRCVLPGRYVFAGDGPSLRWRTDPAVFSIPPTFNPSLTRF